MAAVNGHNGVNERAIAHAAHDKEIRDQKRKKWTIYAIIFVVAHIVMIAVFSFTIMKVRTPKFRIRSATFDVQTTTNPSFNLKMNAQFGVKNTNFGPYKYENNTVDFFYRGTPIGSAVFPKSKASFRSTKKFNVVVDLITPPNMARNSELASDLKSGILPLTVQSRLNGKVTIMFMYKKKKNILLNCTVDANISTKQLQNLKCN